MSNSGAKSGKTIAEKVLARASNQNEVKAGDYVTARYDLLYNVHTKLPEDHDRLKKAGLVDGLPRFADPERVAFMLGDSVGCGNNAAEAQVYKFTREMAAKYGVRKLYDVDTGICHTVVSDEGLARPGMLVCGEDSHSTTGGAVNALATSLSATETIWGYLMGELWFRVPESIKFICKGRLPTGAMAKDVFLYVIGKYTPSLAQYKSLEWKGPVIDAMSMDERFTLACHSVELGAKCAPFEPDDKCLEFVKATPNGNEPFWVTRADPDATYEKTYEEDLSALEPQVAIPHGFDVVKPVGEVEGIKIDQCNLGSCASSRDNDLAMVARILKGRRTKVRTVFYTGSWKIYRRAVESGVVGTLVDAGVMVMGPSCGPCSGHAAALANGDVAIAATARNFRGRFGSPNAEIYLASPATAAASAVMGEITDPRKFL